MKLDLGSRKLNILGVTDPDFVDTSAAEAYEAVVESSSALDKAIMDVFGELPPKGTPTVGPWDKYASPKDVPIDEFFPLKTYRPLQREAIQDIITAFFPKEKGGKGKRFVILEGETGSGKSFQGVTAAKAAGSSYISTSQRMLQDQYAKDFVKVSLDGKYEYQPIQEAEDELDLLKEKLSDRTVEKAAKTAIKISVTRLLKQAQEKVLDEEYRYIAENKDAVVMLKGKGNYKCPRYGTPSEPLFLCSYAPCMTESNETIVKTIKAQCLSRNMCPYYKERARAIAAKHTIVNFKNLILLSMFKVLGQRPLMVLDEAHCLESVLFDFVDTTISRKTLKPIIATMKAENLELLTCGLESEEDVMAFVQDVVHPAVRRKLASLEAGEFENLDEAPDIEDEDSEYQVLSKLSYKLKFLIEFAEGGGSLVLIPNMVPNENNKTKLVQDGYKIKPLSVAQMFDKVFAAGRQVLLMSATILDFDAYCKTLGIPVEEAEFIRVPSTFPKENHPFYFRSVGGMGMRDIQNTLPLMCEEIEKILEKHKGQKGLIHTVNFTPITKYFHDWFSRKEPRLLFHMPDVDKFDLIRQHTESKDSTVLVGPGFTEGLDLAGPLCSFIIHAKVPFLSMADPVVKKRMALDERWFNWQTALALVQADGRGMRSATDSCTSYMLDDNFSFYWRKSKTILPSSFRDRVLVED